MAQICRQSCKDLIGCTAEVLVQEGGADKAEVGNAMTPADTVPMDLQSGSEAAASEENAIS